MRNAKRVFFYGVVLTSLLIILAMVNNPQRASAQACGECYATRNCNGTGQQTCPSTWSPDSPCVASCNDAQCTTCSGGGGQVCIPNSQGAVCTIDTCDDGRVCAAGHVYCLWDGSGWGACSKEVDTCAEPGCKAGGPTPTPGSGSCDLCWATVTCPGGENVTCPAALGTECTKPCDSSSCYAQCPGGGPTPTPGAGSCGECIYSEGTNCYQGKCSGTPCSFNQNCTYSNCGAPATCPGSGGSCGECYYTQNSGCPDGSSLCCFQGKCNTLGDPNCIGKTNVNCGYNNCGASVPLSQCGGGGACDSRVVSAPTITGGTTCSSCIESQNSGLVSSIKNLLTNNWCPGGNCVQSCTNHQLINYWCASLSSSDCQTKKTACGSACGVAPSPGSGTTACALDGQPCQRNEDCQIGDACKNFICSDKDYFYTGVGVCVQNIVPPSCNPDQLTMKMDPNPIPLGSTVTLTLSGGQGSTYVLDQFSNDIIGNCSWTANNPDACNPKNPLYHPSGTGCGFWNTLTCKALKPGTATWTHYWRNCAPNNCNITSRQCEKYITISVLAGPTPLPPAGPCLGNICPTQIGPFDVSNPQAIIKTILIIVLGIAGFAAVILIVYSGYIFMSSGGDKQKIAAAREILTASLLGLLFIIFSVLILEVIGIHILQIPGLG